MGTHQRRGLPYKRTILRSRSLLELTPSKAQRRAQSSGSFFGAGWLLSIPVYLLMFQLFRDVPGLVGSESGAMLRGVLRVLLPFLISYLLLRGFRRWSSRWEQNVLQVARRILYDEGRMAEFLACAEEGSQSATRGGTATSLISQRCPRQNSTQLLARLVKQTTAEIDKQVPGTRIWSLLGGNVDRHVWKVLGEQLDYVAVWFQDDDLPASAVSRQPSNAYGIQSVELAIDYLRNCDSVWPPLRCRSQGTGDFAAGSSFAEQQQASEAEGA